MRVAARRLASRPSARDELSYVPVFVTAFLLLAVVGVALFLGNTGGVVPVESAPSTRLAVHAAVAAPRRSPPTPVPTSVAVTLPGPLADVLNQVTPVTSSTAISRALPTSAPESVTAAPTSMFPQSVVHVGNTGGDGVFVRHTPVLSDRWIAWPDHTPFVLLGDKADGDGEHWLLVRDPKENVGWVPARYLTP